MVTMSDVARLANVSASTVSHVINGTRKVNPKTEKAVRDAIEVTGYSGDAVARSLRTGRSQTIGLAMSAMSNPYFGDLVHALEQTAASEGYSPILVDTHDTPEQELRALQDLLSHRVDGIVLAPAATPQAACTQLARRRVPLVLIDRVPDESLTKVDAVGVHNTEPVAQLIDHLVTVHHHTRIGMLTPKPGITTTRERIAGFHSGLGRNGIDPRSAQLEYAGETPDETVAAINRMFDTTNPPTALVLGNNLVTVNTIAALRRRGIVPPQGIATVSFDDFPWADSFQPRLTTMSQPVDELGATAMRLLLDRMSDPGLESRYLRLDPELMIRESCGCQGTSTAQQHTG